MTIEKNKNAKQSGTFEALNSNAEIFVEIIKQKWWKLFCNDTDLYIDIRKDNKINVYYYGNSLASIKYTKNKFEAKIHEKFLGNENKKYAELDLASLNEKKIKDFKENIKKYHKPENKIKGIMILNNKNYIDSDFKYNRGKELLEFDLIDFSNGELSFVELKRISDSRLINDPKRNKRKPEIIEQMEKYEKFINEPKNESKIINYYKKLIQLKNDLGVFKSKPNFTFTLNKKPKLIIIDTYEKPLTKRREKRINDIETLLKKHNINYKIRHIDTLRA